MGAFEYNVDADKRKNFMLYRYSLQAVIFSGRIGCSWVPYGCRKKEEFHVIPKSTSNSDFSRIYWTLLDIIEEFQVTTQSTLLEEDWYLSTLKNCIFSRTYPSRNCPQCWIWFYSENLLQRSFKEHVIAFGLIRNFTKHIDN